MISSTAAQVRVPLASNYCVSKHAIGRFNEYVAAGKHPDHSQQQEDLTVARSS
jgi:short-subunit dehydrogenase